MKISVIESWFELEELAKDWQRLLEASGENRVFLSWFWVDAWREASREKVAPLVICVRLNSDELVGILPLWRTRMRLLGCYPVRGLRFLGDSSSAFEYPTPIMDYRYENEVLSCMASALDEIRDWDLLWLPNSWSSYEGSTWQILASGRFLTKARTAEFSRFSLPRSWSEYEQSLGSNHRQKNRSLVRKFRSSGGEFEVCTLEEQVDEYLQALFVLNHKRWAVVGQSGSFANHPGARRFYECFVPVAFERGWLYMTGYRVDGELKAVQFGFRFGETYMQIQEGFDPELPAGLGNALRYFSIQQLVESGTTLYDFLGGHTEHKRRWGGERQVGFDLMMIANRRPLLRLLLQRVWPTGRWLKDPSRQFLDDISG